MGVNICHEDWGQKCEARGAEGRGPTGPTAGVRVLERGLAAPPHSL